MKHTYHKLKSILKTMNHEDKKDLLHDYQLLLMAEKGNPVPKNVRLYRKTIAIIKTDLNKE